MVIIDKKQISGIPLLEVYPKNAKGALPTVFFIHGITSAKEHNLHYAYLLAERNMRVILPEALYHGERNNGESNRDITLRFWDIVTQTILELNQLKRHYVKSELTIESKIGLAGTSMGGIVTLGALTQYDWINSAVSLMGNPAYESFAWHLIHQIKESGFELPFTEERLKEEVEKLRTFDLSQQPEKLQKRPLLFWHGKKDKTVPFDFAYNFYQEVKDQYQDFPEGLQFIADEAADHKVSRQGLLATVDWFEKYLLNVN